MRPLVLFTFALSLVAPVSAADAKLASRLYMAAAPANPLYGDALSIGVLVMGADSPIPTGTVTVTWSGGSAVATLDATGHGSVRVPVFPAGPATFGGSYSGDANYNPCPQGLSVPIAQVGSVVTLSSPPPQIGQPVTVTAVVSPANWASVVPTGSVAFDRPGCGAVALQNGVAHCTATFTQVGAATITAAYSGDSNVLAGSGSVGVTVGKLAPTAYLAAAPASILYGEAVTLTALVLGAQSGPAPAGSVTFTEGAATLGSAVLGADGRARLLVPLFSAGSHSVVASYAGDANYQSAAAPAITLAVGKVAATVSLAATPAQIGQPVTVKAVVTPSNFAPVVPTGWVTFNAPGCSSVPVANGIAACTTAFAQVGAFVLTASYSGDTNVSAANASLPVNVGKVAASVYLAATPIAPLYGDSVTLDALVLRVDGAPAATGSMTFADFPLALGSAPVGSDGHAYLTVPSLMAGTHNITTSYVGDANYQSGSAALSLSVARVATSVAIASTAAQLNQPVTLKATVALANYADAPLEGTVSFTALGIPIPGCAKLTLQNRTASCGITFAQLGTVSIGVTYTGDSNTSPATATMQVAVAHAAASVYAGANLGGQVYGASATLTALVLGASGLPSPAGSVTFSDSAIPLGNVPLGTGGRASLPLSVPLRAGTHAITVTYSGDGNYGTATSDAESITVSRAGTAVALSAQTGGPFIAAVSVTAPGAGVPSGNVQFLAGGAVFATVPLQGGVATLTSAAQTGTITASYTGDSNFAPSTSVPTAVAQPRALVAVTSDHNPATAGQPILFTVYVTPNAGSTTPTGRVVVAADGVTLGNFALTAATASVSASLASGSHSVSASYSGDTTYPPATGNLTQTVSKSAASLSLTASATNIVYGQPVTLTAQLTAPGDDAPAGDIQLWDGGVNISSIRALTKLGSFLHFPAAAGMHLISATWAGDSLWSAATSNSVAITVAKASTRTAGSAAADGMAANVAAVAPGSGTPTGTVGFIDGTSGVLIATAELSGGMASAAAAANSSVIAVYSGDGNFLPSNSPVFSLVAVTNAASYEQGAVAPDEIVSVFASGIAVDSVSSPDAMPSLGGVSVKVADASGAVLTGGIFFVSPNQAEVRLPGGLAKGPATLFLTTARGTTLSTPIVVGTTASGLFTADASGQGAPVGQAVRYHRDGTSEPPVTLTEPIGLGEPGDSVYLTLYGTGIRHFTSGVACTIGGTPAVVVYAGPQPDFAGLDQVNVLVPEGVSAGSLTLILSVDGTTAHAVLIKLE